MYDSLQEQILTLIEENRTDLNSQLQYWNLERKVQAVLYYAKREGHRHLGLQQVPAAIASEYKGKQAIALTLLLKSLAKSPFASETWTLGDTGAELVLATEPKNTFKKQGYEVTVFFDNDRNNSYPYTNWDRIYYQDERNNWIVTPGLVDYNGMFYVEADGTQAYFILFADNANRFGNTGQWTVQYKNKTIYPPVTSSRHSGGTAEEAIVIDSGSDRSESPAGRPESPVRERSIPTSKSTQQAAGASPSEREKEARVGRGLGQGEQRSEPPVKKARADSSQTGRSRRPSPRRRGRRGRGGGGGRGGGSPVSPEEVGENHQTVATRGLDRLERLQAEARDPPIISVQGHPNTLKCWRNRLPKVKEYYTNATTVFRWVLHNRSADQQGRVLISFANATQRHRFLCNVKIPKNCTYTFGSLNEL